MLQSLQPKIGAPTSQLIATRVIALIILLGASGCGVEGDQFEENETGKSPVIAENSLDSQSSRANSATEQAKQLILGLTVSPDSIYCPQGYQYNPALKLCGTDVEVLGPFPKAMQDLCVERGGGEACSKDRWDIKFALWVRGDSICALGSQREEETGLCLDQEYAYGPFSIDHVNNCLHQGGGEACQTMRWDRAIAFSSLPASNQADPFSFPFDGPAELDYLSAPRSFGSCRDNCKRKHAAADLYGNTGRFIYAVADGVVKDRHYFYDGTYALVVDHGGFIVRYGEIKKNLAPNVAIGSKVKRGQHIAYVGDLSSLSVSMLHFERFSGKGSGPLTQTSNYPFQRRWDLENPTTELLKWKYPR